MGFGFFDWVVQNSFAVAGDPIIAGIFFLILIIGLVAALEVNGYIALLFIGALIALFAMNANVGGFGIIPGAILLIVVFFAAGIVMYAWRKITSR